MDALVGLAGLVVAAVVGGGLWTAFAGRIAPGERPSLGRCLLALVVCLALLLVGFVGVVQARCALGWIDEAECPAWGGSD